MSSSLYGYNRRPFPGAQAEYEFEDEFEFEGEYEGEYEGEEFAFFRNLAARARLGLQNQVPRLRNLAQRASRAARAAVLRNAMSGVAVHGLPMPALPPEPPPIVAPAPGPQAGAGPLPPEQEWEGEWEFEDFSNPVRRVYPDALMEHLGHAAAAAESEAEAEAFIGALIPLAARLVPQAATAITRAAPHLIRGAAAVTRTLRQDPSTRPLVRTVPTIVRRTAATLAQQSAQGQPVTPRVASAALAQQAARVLGSPQQSVQAYQRSRAMDRRYHAAGGAGGQTGAGRCPSCGVPRRVAGMAVPSAIPAVATRGRILPSR